MNELTELLEELKALNLRIAGITHKLPDRMDVEVGDERGLKRLQFMQWAKANIGSGHSQIATGIEYLEQGLL